MPKTSEDRLCFGPMRTRGAALGVVAAAMLTVSCAARSPAPASSPPPLHSTLEYGEPTSSPVLDTDRTIAGESLAWPDSALPMIVSRIVTIAPGQSTGWHRHGVPTYGYFLSGTLEVEYAGQGRRTFHAGDALVEAMKVPHVGANVGDEPVRILVVSMAIQGKPLAVKTEAPSMPAGLGGQRPSDLVDLAQVDPSLRIDLRYAGTNNFTGRVFYPAPRALMQRPAAEALRRVNERARKEGFALLVMDAYRPWSVTRVFWDEYPMHRGYLADPLQGSRHNRGCAVDLTLVDLTSGREVTMPSVYDDFSERAHPAYPGGTAAEREARDRLRRLMEAEGFTVYDNEWWHFDYTGWQDWPVLDMPLDAASTSK